MSEPIPEEYTDLFEKRAFAHLATLLPHGTPHVTPVWVDYDGEHLLVNTPQGTRKDRNMQEQPHVALSIQDPENPLPLSHRAGPSGCQHRRRRSRSHR
jgi:PPOX class probable F420-dependent enzyme